MILIAGLISAAVMTKYPSRGAAAWAMARASLNKMGPKMKYESSLENSAEKCGNSNKEKTDDEQ